VIRNAPTKYCLALVATFLCTLSLAQTPATCEDKANSPITNFCIASKSILWRGAKPDVAGAKWLIENGVASIVNLELLHDDLAILRSIETSTAAKVEYYKLRDWEPLVVLKPSKTDTTVAKFIAIATNAPKPLYVHCRSGQNRTGVMVAAYRIIAEGVSVENAIEEMKSYEGIWAKQDAQYLQTMTPEKIARIKQAAQTFTVQTKPNAVVKCAQGTCDR
jgi:protein tyrosine phosphatase (PTP) superfamily phosphohydrolase (DUF442 family)